jgi:hypothetical protein
LEVNREGPPLARKGEARYACPPGRHPRFTAVDIHAGESCRGASRRNCVLRCAPARKQVRRRSFNFRIAIEARCRWLEAHRRSDMVGIGPFNKVGSDFRGEIITLSLQAKASAWSPRTIGPTTTPQPPHLRGPGGKSARLVKAARVLDLKA